MINIRTQWGNRPRYAGKDFSVNGGDPISMTIPDLSMSINEMLRRYQSGLPMMGEKVPLYLGENDATPDINRLDLAELEEMRDKAREEYKKRKRMYDQQQREAAEKKAKQKEAHQGPTVQRTTGDEDDRTTNDAPDNPISVKTWGGGAKPPDTGKGR